MSKLLRQSVRRRATRIPNHRLYASHAASVSTLTSARKDATLPLVVRAADQDGSKWLSVAAMASAGVALAAFATDDRASLEAKDSEELSYAEAVESIRAQVSEFRSALKSKQSHVPQSYPIPKISISRIKAPNGVSTIRIEFNCPTFVDQEAILGRFISTLGAKETIQTVPVTSTTMEGHKYSTVQYVYTSGCGSFHFLRDLPTTLKQSRSFVFYKDHSMSTAEVDAVVDAYKELYAPTNVRRFRAHNMEDRRRLMRADQTEKQGKQGGGKQEAIQQLESLGIDVYEPMEGERSLTWDSIAGYDGVKQEIQDTVVLALQHPELYDDIARKTRFRYESNRPRAVLMEGPPGTGKTLSARVIAQEAGVPMIHLPIENVVSKWYGESEKKMASIFDACEKLDGAIIFIDEIDALAGDRSGGNMHEASRRILSVLLQKVEGFASAQKTTVICATNRKEDLDSALLSRFDLAIRYDLPDDATRKAVFERYAKQLTDKDLTDLAGVSAGLSCRDVKEICEYAERKWASRVVRKEARGDLPSIELYMEAVKMHTRGLSRAGASDDVVEA